VSSQDGGVWGGLWRGGGTTYGILESLKVRNDLSVLKGLGRRHFRLSPSIIGSCSMIGQ